MRWLYRWQNFVEIQLDLLNDWKSFGHFCWLLNGSIQHEVAYMCICMLQVFSSPQKSQNFKQPVSEPNSQSKLAASSCNHIISSWLQRFSNQAQEALESFWTQGELFPQISGKLNCHGRWKAVCSYCLPLSPFFLQLYIAGFSYLSSLPLLSS